MCPLHIATQQVDPYSIDRGSLPLDVIQADIDTTRYVCLRHVHLVSEDHTDALSPLTSVWLDTTNGTIIGFDSVPPCVADDSVTAIDCGGHILSSGMIDIQINGGFGVDLSEYTSEHAYHEGVAKLAGGLLRIGVTSFVPTIISQKPEVYHKVLPLLESAGPGLCPASTQQAEVLGWHAEGPFITKAGCHTRENLSGAPDGIEDVQAMYGPNLMRTKEITGSTPVVKIVTLAPDVPGILPAIDELSSQGVVVSIGHTNATTKQALAAVHNGASLITHLFNAMPGLHHRDPGVIGLLGLPLIATASQEKQMAKSLAMQVKSAMTSPVRTPGMAPFSPVTPTSYPWHQYGNGAKTASTTPTTPLSPAWWTPSTLGLANLGGMTPVTPVSHDPTDEVTARSERLLKRPFFSIIADGVHVHPQAVTMAYNAHPTGCVLVSDAMHMLDPDLEDGVYDWREGQRIEKRGGAIMLEGTDTLAGSILPLPQAVRNLSTFAGIPLSQAILCATATPAQALGAWVAERKGRAEVGADADLVLWEKNSGEILAVWKGGRRVIM